METLLGELHRHEDEIDPRTGRSRAALVRGWQLLIAAHRGQRRLAEVLIKGGADPNGCESTGVPLVAEAAFRFDWATIEMLVELGGDVNGFGPDRRVLALDMALDRQPALVAPLLEIGANPNLQTRHFFFRPSSGATRPIPRTPVATAFAQGLGPFVQLVNAGGRIEDAFPHMLLDRVAAEYCWADRMDYLRLLGYDDAAIHERPHLLAAAGLTSEIEAMIGSGNVDPRDQYGRTPLVMAVLCGRTETVRWLLDRGAEANQLISWVWTDDTPGLSSDEEQDSLEGGAVRSRHDGKPLISAAPGPVIAALLLDAGADPNRSYSSEWNRMTAAHDTSIPESVARVLLHRGLDPSRPNAEGNTALHATCARFGGDPDRARLLLGFGAVPDTRNAWGETALHRSGDGTLRELIRSGANVNAADKDGQTPLMTQAMAGSVEAVVELLAHGADPGLRDHDGRSAADYAMEELGELSTNEVPENASERMKLQQLVGLLSGAGRQDESG